MSTVETAGLLGVDAPLPQPRQYTLLDGATLVTDTNDRWLAGIWVGGYPPGPAYTFDPCGSGTYRTKEEAGTIARSMNGSFTVYLPVACTARSIGSSLTEFINRARAAFEAIEATAVERFLVDGDGHSTLGPYLGDPNLEILNSGTAVTPTEGLALLEKEIATVGNGVIHVAPATATYWVSELLIAPDRAGKMRTGIGTLVVVGAGYQGALPDDAQGALPADREWAFASGPIQYRRSEVFPLPDNYPQAIDRSVNDVVIYIERHYVLSWVGRIDSSDETNIQAAVLIDRQT